MKHSDLTSAIIGICIEVHRELGPGLLESIYEQAVCLELENAGYTFECQKGIKTFYKSRDLGLGFRADIIVENKILLELKSIAAVLPIHKKIVLTYLRLTNNEVGLIVNFNEARLTDGITRLVNG